MLVKNKETGAIETMRYDPAVAAVEAGTHEMVSSGVGDEEATEQKAGRKTKSKPKPDEA